MAVKSRRGLLYSAVVAVQLVLLVCLLTRPGERVGASLKSIRFHKWTRDRFSGGLSRRQPVAKPDPQSSANDYNCQSNSGGFCDYLQNQAQFETQGSQGSQDSSALSSVQIGNLTCTSRGGFCNYLKNLTAPGDSFQLQGDNLQVAGDTSTVPEGSSPSQPVQIGNLTCTSQGGFCNYLKNNYQPANGFQLQQLQGDTSAAQDSSSSSSSSLQSVQIGNLTCTSHGGGFCQYLKNVAAPGDSLQLQGVNLQAGGDTQDSSSTLTSVQIGNYTCTSKGEFCNYLKNNYQPADSFQLQQLQGANLQNEEDTSSTKQDSSSSSSSSSAQTVQIGNYTCISTGGFCQHLKNLTVPGDSLQLQGANLQIQGDTSSVPDDSSSSSSTTTSLQSVQIGNYTCTSRGGFCDYLKNNYQPADSFQLVPASASSLQDQVDESNNAGNTTDSNGNTAALVAAGVAGAAALGAGGYGAGSLAAGAAAADTPPIDPEDPEEDDDDPDDPDDDPKAHSSSTTTMTTTTSTSSAAMASNTTVPDNFTIVGYIISDAWANLDNGINYNASASCKLNLTNSSSLSSGSDSGSAAAAAAAGGIGAALAQSNDSSWQSSVAASFPSSIPVTNPDSSTSQPSNRSILESDPSGPQLTGQQKLQVNLFGWRLVPGLTTAVRIEDDETQSNVTCNIDFGSAALNTPTPCGSSTFLVTITIRYIDQAPYVIVWRVGHTVDYTGSTNPPSGLSGVVIKSKIFNETCPTQTCSWGVTDDEFDVAAAAPPGWVGDKVIV